MKQAFLVNQREWLNEVLVIAKASECCPFEVVGGKMQAVEHLLLFVLSLVHPKIQIPSKKQKRKIDKIIKEVGKNIFNKTIKLR